ncbi:MAG: hypothetical protein MJ104_02540 [Lachnospiraceae bacterium]|nr:hypothetical protein [Lachnospiraceae bacterium]
MELRYDFMIYICIALVILVSMFFVLFNTKKKGYKDGKKIAGLDYVRKTGYFKFKMVSFRILSVLSLVSLVGCIVFSCFMIARPYERYTIEEEKYSRDIILCMDISTSVDELNQSLMGSLKETVKDLKNERIGILIFNTTPVLLCPLTDDYEYVLSVLDQVDESLRARNTYMYSFWNDYDDLAYDYDYISEGTIIGNEERGSSLIGDGLAAAAYSFTSDDPDRSKVVIFSTDNCLEGIPLVTTQEAADICTKNNVVVYGVGTYMMYDDDEEAMKKAVESTGGKYYREDYSGSMKMIVEDIEQMSGALIGGTKEVRDYDVPEGLFGWLLATTIIFIVSARVLKL